jgi:hypothetical protein
MSYRDAVLKALEQKHMTIRGLSEAVGHSYEHCRKIVSGAPVVSRELNKQICQVLHLSTAEMWTIARKEKAAARFGADFLVGVLDTQEQLFFALWRRLERPDRAILMRVAAGLGAIARRKTPNSKRKARTSVEND